MAWIAVSDHDGHIVAPAGLGNPQNSADLVDMSGDALMVRGSLVIETRVPATRRPRPLVLYNKDGDWPLHLSLQVVPGGGLTLILDQGGEILHRTINHSETGRADVVRITYSWDARTRIGRLALERTDQDNVILVPVASPRPLRYSDALALICPGEDRYVAPDVLYLALSTAIEPVGPMPSLMPDTPVATPTGYRPICEMRRGDTVLTPEGEIVPVLHVIHRQVPASGSFHPVRMRAPYFGLLQDITVAPSQRLVLSGSEVEYLFGREAVLVPACHLAGGTTAKIAHTGPIVTYWQLLLPGHQALLVAGTSAESLYIARLRRKIPMLNASLLAGLDRNSLPEHGKLIHPVLRPFDAQILAEQRAA